jgi:hypothetical protein
MSVRICQYAMGRLGASSISNQCRSPGPYAFGPIETLPIGSEAPIRS